MRRFIVIIFLLSLCFVSSVLATEKIDINTAPLEDLTNIIHIGEGRAEELISLRPFYSLDDLVRIRGIGPARLEDIKNQGLAWVNPELEPPENEKDVKPLTPQSHEKQVHEKQAHEKQVYKKPLVKNQQLPKSLRVFLISFGLAGFSGGIIFALKKRLEMS